MRQLREGRDDLQPRDFLKVPDIERGHIESKVQGGHSDSQVFEGEGCPLCRPLPLYPPDIFAYLQRYRMDRDVTAQFFDKA